MIPPPPPRHLVPEADPNAPPAGNGVTPPSPEPEGDVSAIALAASPETAAPAAPAIIHTPPDQVPLTHRPANVPDLAHRPQFLSHRLHGAKEHVQLHWSAWLAVVPFAVVSLMTASTYARAQGMGSTGTITYMFVSVIWGLVTACAMAWTAWRLRGHTQMAAT